MNALLPQPEISLILPAYEEAENLKHLLPRIKSSLQGLQTGFEILVIDAEAPRDNTAEICTANQVQCHARRGGSRYGDAIRTGIGLSQGQYVVIMDADGSHDPAFIHQLWPYRKQFDLVIASRYIPGGRTDNPFILIFLSLMVNLIFRFVLNLKCWDVSNSFRLYRGDQLRRLKLECLDFDIVEEILVTLKPADNKTLQLKEVPFTFQKRQAGKTKRNLIAFAFSYLQTLHKLSRIKNRANFAANQKGVK